MCFFCKRATKFHKKTLNNIIRFLLTYANRSYQASYEALLGFSEIFVVLAYISWAFDFVFVWIKYTPGKKFNTTRSEKYLFPLSIKKKEKLHVECDSRTGTSNMFWLSFHMSKRWYLFSGIAGLPYFMWPGHPYSRSHWVHNFYKL